jgi:hypothetical protein
MRSEGVILMVVVFGILAVVSILAYLGLSDYIEVIKESFRTLNLIA